MSSNEQPKTACVKCKYSTIGWCDIPPTCRAPALSAEWLWSPVSGKVVRYPHPGNVNDGNCPHYEPKLSWWRRLRR